MEHKATRIHTQLERTMTILDDLNDPHHHTKHRTSPFSPVIYPDTPQEPYIDLMEKYLRNIYVNLKRI